MGTACLLCASLGVFVRLPPVGVARRRACGSGSPRHLRRDSRVGRGARGGLACRGERDGARRVRCGTLGATISRPARIVDGDTLERVGRAPGNGAKASASRVPCRLRDPGPDAATSRASSPGAEPASTMSRVGGTTIGPASTCRRVSGRSAARRMPGWRGGGGRSGERNRSSFPRSPHLKISGSG